MNDFYTEDVTSYSRSQLLPLLGVLLVGLIAGYLIRDVIPNVKQVKQIIPISCNYNGRTYNSGESIPAGDGCNSCSCENGNVACTTIACGGDELPPIEEKGCTQEAKVCPDGSYVGRSGPNCEFDPCPYQ